MREVLLILGLLLAGCGSPDPAPGTQDDGTGVGPGAEATTGGSTTLRFEQVADAATETRTFTVQPHDACVPGCAGWTATGQGEWLQVIDLGDLVPPGSVAMIELEATWDESPDGSRIQNANLQWWYEDFGFWVTGGVREEGDGRAFLSGQVAHHGPQPPEAVLVIIEPENVEPVEIDVEITVTPLAEDLPPYHPVVIDVPPGTTLGVVQNGTYEEAWMQIRDPSAAVVAQMELQQGRANATIPTNATGPFTLFTRAWNGQGTFLVWADVDSADAPPMTLLDIAPVVGDVRPVPSGEETTWTVDFQEPPFWIAIRLGYIEGGGVAQDVQLQVDGPRGTLIEGAYSCEVCGWGLSSWGGPVGGTLLEAGTYTFSVRSDAAARMQVADVTATYG